jgi:hypothetical protein
MVNKFAFQFIAFSQAIKGDLLLSWELIMWESSFCVNSLLETFIDKLRNHFNIDELTKHDFIPLEAGLRNMVKNGRLPY